MGTMTISTAETTIYYPSDWLVTGGPPFETMGCPEYDENCDNDPDKLSLNIDQRTGVWQIIQNGAVVMESMNKKDITTYFRDYMNAIELWMEGQKKV